MPYYNAMLTGADHSINACTEVYDRLRGYKIYVISSCGFGVDASCNKRIRFDGVGGINAVRYNFNTVIEDLDLSLHSTINSKKSCVF